MDAFLIVAVIFIGLPWIVMHYLTQWKTAATITSDDEVLLEKLFALSERLEQRMETVERLVAADHPDFQPLPRASTPAPEEMSIEDIEQRISLVKGTRP